MARQSVHPSTLIQAALAPVRRNAEEVERRGPAHDDRVDHERLGTGASVRRRQLVAARLAVAIANCIGSPDDLHWSRGHSFFDVKLCRGRVWIVGWRYAIPTLSVVPTPSFAIELSSDSACRQILNCSAEEGRTERAVLEIYN